VRFDLNRVSTRLGLDLQKIPKNSVCLEWRVYKRAEIDCFAISQKPGAMSPDKYIPLNHSGCVTNKKLLTFQLNKDKLAPIKH
jgi:hypothetical protein